MGGAGSEAHVDVQHAQDVGLLAHLLVLARVDGDDLRAPLRQRVGGGEPRHPEAGHDHPQPLPVGARVVEPGEVPHRFTTHSA